MFNRDHIFPKLLALLISGILALQYIPVTFNGKTVIIDISCCKDLKDCCSSGAQACSIHKNHGETGSYTSCHASADLSVYIFMVSKGVFYEAPLAPILFSGVYITPPARHLSPQDPIERLFKPPKAFLHG